MNLFHTDYHRNPELGSVSDKDYDKDYDEDGVLVLTTTDDVALWFDEEEA